MMSHIKFDATKSPVRVIGAGYPMKVIDATGHEVVIPRQPRRIISLAPAVTEVLFAINAGDRVKADTTFCNYPPAAKSLPKVGGFSSASVEKITALSPDLIIGERGNQKEVLDHLRSLGLPILVVDPKSFDDVVQTIITIGNVVGNNDSAKQLADQFIAQKSGMQSSLADIPAAKRPRTLLLFSLDGSLFSVGPGSYIDDLIRLAGGYNVASTTNTPWPILSMEAVVASDPQVLLLLKGHGASANLSKAQILARLRNDEHWRGVTAVKTGRVELLDDDLITLPGPRLINGLGEVAAAIHPEFYIPATRP